MAGDLRPALIGSAAVHLGVVLAGVVAWPHREEPPKPPPVPVMLVSAPPGADAAPPDVDPGPPAPALRPQPTPPQRAQPAPAPKPAPPAAKAAPPAPAAEPGLDLAALRNRLARSRPSAPPAPPGPSASSLADAQAALVARLQDAWNPNCGVPGGSKVTVRVRFTLSEDGRVSDGPDVVGGLSSDPVARAAQDRAVRAVLANQPYDWLPKEALGVSYAPRFNAEEACRG